MITGVFLDRWVLASVSAMVHRQRVKRPLHGQIGQALTMRIADVDPDDFDRWPAKLADGADRHPNDGPFLPLRPVSVIMPGIPRVSVAVGSRRGFASCLDRMIIELNRSMGSGQTPQRRPGSRNGEDSHSASPDRIGWRLGGRLKSGDPEGGTAATVLRWVALHLSPRSLREFPAWTVGHAEGQHVGKGQ